MSLDWLLGTVGKWLVTSGQVFCDYGKRDSGNESHLGKGNSCFTQIKMYLVT